MKLQKDKYNKKFLGVCAGISNSTGIDVTIIRLAFTFAAVFGFGSAVVVYFIMAIIMP